LLNEPKLLVLDEPTSGLDPGQVIAVRDLIRELAGRQTVLIASHVLTEIEQIANRVMILLDGRLLTADAMTQGGRGQRLRLQVAGTEQAVRDCIGAVPGVRSIASENAGSAGPVTYLVDADARPQLAQELAAALIGHGLALCELTPLPPDLERIFLDLTRHPQEAAA
jgi:ABC-2 type transport system ATP-binding protein